MKLFLVLALAVTCFAETYRFEPKEFYNTFSGAHKPVLRIKPGDHVITSTIDAGGTDAAGVRRGQGPNPETGPFFIEGAEPGDTLVVHLLRLATNRAELAALRSKIANVETAELFSAATFTRHLESAYSSAVARFRSGLSPADIVVEGG